VKTVTKNWIWLFAVLLAAVAVFASTVVTSSATVPARASWSASSVAFGTRGTDTTSLRELTLTNRGSNELYLQSLSIQGASADDYSFETNCPGLNQTGSMLGTGLSARQSCRVTLRFLPKTAGQKTALLTLSSSVGSSTVTLSGVAEGPAVTFSPSKLNFTKRFAGTVSDARGATLRNPKRGLLKIQSLTLAGPDASHFSLSQNCTDTLEGKEFCTLMTRFAPIDGGVGTGGIKTAAIEVTSNAGVFRLALSGEAVVPSPAVTVSTSAVAFNAQGTETTSAEKIVTIKSTGTAPLFVSGVTLVGADAAEFSQENDCGAAIAPKASCRVALRFKPATEGTKAGSLRISTNVTPEPTSLSLSGVALGPNISVSPTKLSFDALAAGSSPDQRRITVRNKGKGMLRIRYVTRMGADKVSFVQSNNCGLPVAGGSSCSISVSFYPSSLGKKSAEIVIATHSEPRAAVIALEGQLRSSATTRPISRREAFRFLNQATFGATEADVKSLGTLGDSSAAYARWIDEQVVKSVSLQLPALVASVPAQTDGRFDIPGRHQIRVEQWFENVLYGEDQLRQRVAWALSQIFVVSDQSILFEFPFATAHFYDMLARNAFGNYRDLLEQVTLHPAMGNYLSHLGNRRAAPGTNLRPDENYAREMMQLFSIGLVELESDGSVRRDSEGQPIQTYNPEVIAGFARVFTGWHWQCPKFDWLNAENRGSWSHCAFSHTQADRLPVTPFNQTAPMQLFPEEHEDGPKRVLAYAGMRLQNATIPAGQGGEKDLDDALDNVFYHPNVGPFIGKQFIQKLVTSNPSPDYVRAVAETFNDDGRGVRGNLEAVVRAVLLHPEARGTPTGPAAGKLKEPLLRLTQFWRAFEAKPYGGKFSSSIFCCSQTGFSPGSIFGQSPNQSPSVFNFYSPFYAPPGEISRSGLVAPEMQLSNENLHTVMSSFLFRQVQWSGSRFRSSWDQGFNPESMVFKVDAEWSIAYDDDKLIDMIATKLLSDPGHMTPALRKTLLAQIGPYQRYWQPGDPSFEGLGNDNHLRRSRIADVIYFILTSPEYAWQR
jgi:uncharacterized protein (DUF1800 family)